MGTCQKCGAEVSVRSTRLYSLCRTCAKKEKSIFKRFLNAFPSWMATTIMFNVAMIVILCIPAGVGGWITKNSINQGLIYALRAWAIVCAPLTPFLWLAEIGFALAKRFFGENFYKHAELNWYAAIMGVALLAFVAASFAIIKAVFAL